MFCFKGRVTRTEVQKVEEMKVEPKGRSTSRSKKASPSPVAKPPTPKKAETPKPKASPRQRSATPKKQETPKKKAAASPSPKQKATKAKQKSAPEKKSPAKPKATPPPATKSSRSRRGRGAKEEEEVEGKAEEPEEDEEKAMDVDESAAPAVEDKPTESDEDEEKEDDNVEQDQSEVEAQATEAERDADAAKAEEKKEIKEPELVSKDKDEAKEAEEDAPMENEQAESDEKENESAESEQVESAGAATTSQADVITIKDDTEDKERKSQDNVIDLNEDSGEAVVIGEDSPIVLDLEAADNGSGDKSASNKLSNDVEVISDDEDTNQVNGKEEVNTNNQSEKRKIDEVIDSGEVEVKKAKLDEQTLENGGAEDVAKDYVVVEMGDVPKADSEDVLKSLPNVVNNSEQTAKVNPVYNRVFVPNPAFTSTVDSTKQFSLVSYNMLADCHMLKGDYSFTSQQYLKPEYRLTNVIEELKYLDGDIVCLQEVDPDFFNNQLLPVMKR